MPRRSCHGHRHPGQVLARDRHGGPLSFRDFPDFSLHLLGDHNEALDLSQESDKTKEMYGLNEEITSSYGRRCLMARRLVERGVRFVQIFIERQIWDNHSDLERDLKYCCGKTDKPIGALIRDLKDRGLLDSTLVIWGGEFGRMPISQIRQGTGGAGRDHGPAGFTAWMAGGGVKGGTVYGKTDEIGWNVAEDPVHVNDFHATILHLFGLDHLRLTYRFQGRDFRLTDVGGKVVTKLLA